MFSEFYNYVKEKSYKVKEDTVQSFKLIGQF